MSPNNRPAVGDRFLSHQTVNHFRFGRVRIRVPQPDPELTDQKRMRITIEELLTIERKHFSMSPGENLKFQISECELL